MGAQRAAKRLSALDPALCAEILLLRHGETDWNKEGRLQGQLDPPLNDTGLQQAAALATHFSSPSAPRLDAIYSSDLMRCKQTAEAIGVPLSLPVHLSPQLRERHLGALQGHTIKEAAVQQPLALECLGGSTSRKIPGKNGSDVQGESVDELCSRVSAEIEHIAAKHPGQRVLLVAHGGVIAAAHRRATGEQAARAHNGCINVLRVQSNKWAVVSWGDVSVVGAASGSFGGGEGG